MPRGSVMKEEHFDFVVVAGGHNGTTIAAYLSRCGHSVCVLEARPECGGGQENTEALQGFRIDPHATYLYGAAAPGFEQLELWRYGFRQVSLSPSPSSSWPSSSTGGIAGHGTYYLFAEPVTRTRPMPHRGRALGTIPQRPWPSLGGAVPSVYGRSRLVASLGARSPSRSDRCEARRALRLRGSAATN